MLSLIRSVESRKKMILKYLLVILLVGISLPDHARSGDAFSPWDFATPEVKVEQNPRELSPPAVLLKTGIQFFSKYISPVDGDRCPAYPTCAAYGRQAVEKHGFFLGTLLTVDRLIHDGDERDPHVLIYGKWRLFDPVSNNDFWWRGNNKP